MVIEFPPGTINNLYASQLRFAHAIELTGVCGVISEPLGLNHVLDRRHVVGTGARPIENKDWSCTYICICLAAQPTNRSPQSQRQREDATEFVVPVTAGAERLGTTSFQSGEPERSK